MTNFLQLLTIIPDSDSYINVNPKLSSMGSQSQFHRFDILNSFEY